MCAKTRECPDSEQKDSTFDYISMWDVLTNGTPRNGLQFEKTYYYPSHTHTHTHIQNMYRHRNLIKFDFRPI